jgi:GNAT superfamily N-acetyltransferase
MTHQTPRVDIKITPLPPLGEDLVMHYKRLSSQSRRYRFMGAIPDKGLITLVQKRTEGMAILLSIDNTLRAVCEIYPTSHGRAEVGLSVEDAYQGQGYGRSLVRKALHVAHSLNIDTLDFYFDIANKGIYTLLKEKKAIINIEGTECNAEIKVRKPRPKHVKYISHTLKKIMAITHKPSQTAQNI